ncbi:MAG: hypothetical protein VYD01_03760 [Pseudomonadota bacterium]|nr:hypothetical protein [Pseudomonadota bacterium]
MKITFESTIGANRDGAWSAYTSPHDRSVIQIHNRAKRGKGRLRDIDVMKVLNIRKIPISEIVTMIEHGEMTNAISVESILRVFSDQRIMRADTT